MSSSPEKMHRPERWDVPFGDMPEPAIDRLLGIAPFKDIDASKFPGRVPLRGILKNDARLVSFKKGDIVVREGDYGDAAYFVVRGSVRVVLSRGGEGGLPPETLGRSVTQKKSLLGALAQVFRHRMPEVRNADQNAKGTGARGDHRIFLQDVPAILDKHRTAAMGEGQFFGEIAALGRTPRTASVFADSDAELLEIRWQGLRELRKFAPAIKDHIDKLYRDNSLLVHLRETPMFKHLAPDELARVAEKVRFETYGDFDWYGTYQKLREMTAREKIAREPVIVEEGEYANGVFLLRAGFARVSRTVGHGEVTTSYLGRGEVFGAEEVAHNWRTRAQVPFRHTLRALGYVDVLFVPTKVIEELVLPQLPAELMPEPLPPPEDDREASLVFATEPRTRREAEFREFVVENRLINGRATMLMDLDRCIHCDYCVLGCAAAHDNNPRFVRHGVQLGRNLVANACMHCADPVCMIGCPTGAIHRSESGPVVINDMTCIGCGTCAKSCPYDNIRMVEARNESGGFLVDENSGLPILKATKCDLCLDQLGGPACQRACPHDALIRVDMRDEKTLSKWLAR